MPARDRRPPGHGKPRGLEHLRPHRGHCGGVRCAAHRRAAGAHRPAARRLGPRRGRPPGAARARRRAGRADHRRCRAGPLPRPRQGRTGLCPDAHPGLGPCLPQRRHRAVRRRGAGVQRPGRRPGQGRRPAHRARRGRQRPPLAPGGERRGGGGAPQRGRQQPPGRLRHHRARLRRQGRRRAAAPHDAGRARPAAGRGRHPADPHLRQDRPRRTALAATGPAGHRGIRAGAGRRGHRGLGGGPLDRHPRRRAVRARRRLLRPRRGQPHRGPAREPAARALPRGHRGRRLRPPRPGRAGGRPRRHGHPHRAAELRRAAGAR